MLETLLYCFSLIPFYLIGSLPTGRLIAARQGIDIHSHGSGNQGATNVARTLGKKWGGLTLFVDVCKGLLASALAFLISSSSEFAALAAFAVVAGHCFSIPGKLRGGKGVATALGAFLYFDGSLALAALLLFSLVFWAFRIVSLASVVSALCIPIVAVYMQIDTHYQMSSAAIALLVIIRHKENLKRLSEGNEPRFQTR